MNYRSRNVTKAILEERIADLERRLADAQKQLIEAQLERYALEEELRKK